MTDTATDGAITSPLAHLSEQDFEKLAKEFDAIHDEVFAELGTRDRHYITTVISVHRQIVILGRVLLLASLSPSAATAGTACLSTAKILENMELGHNIMHGQWDWMNDPEVHSSVWDWDTASSAKAWKHSHNYVHHTFTNIRGKDKDLGYEIMRIDPNQKWRPGNLGQPLYNLLLMLLFEWGVALHDTDVEALFRGRKSMADLKDDLASIGGKARQQIVKDYVGWPLVSAGAFAAAQLLLRGRLPQRKESRIARRLRRVDGAGRFGRVPAVLDRVLPGVESTFLRTLTANAISNLVRNIWAHSIIFCGHFPDQTYTFSQDEVEDETRGGWYARQLVGAANIEGSWLFHLMSGNLGYQVEHHLYPDMPSSRYAEIAPKVKEICERYELPYNTGPFGKQLFSVHRSIIRLAFPGGKPRPKPGPYLGAGRDLPVTRQSEATDFRNRLPAEHPDAGPEQESSGVKVKVPERGDD